MRFVRKVPHISRRSVAVVLAGVAATSASMSAHCRAWEARVSTPLSIVELQGRWPAAESLLRQFPDARAYGTVIGNVTVIRIVHFATCYLANCWTSVGIPAFDNNSVSTVLLATDKIFVSDTSEPVFPGAARLIFDCELQSAPCKAEVIVTPYFVTVSRSDLNITP